MSNKSRWAWHKKVGGKALLHWLWLSYRNQNGVAGRDIRPDNKIKKITGELWESLLFGGLLLLMRGTTDPRMNQESQMSNLLLTVLWCASSWTKESHHCALYWRTLVSAAVPPLQLDSHLATQQPLRPLSEIWGSILWCGIWIPDLWSCWQLSWQWSSSSDCHSDSYKQFCPKISKHSKAIHPIPPI